MLAALLCVISISNVFCILIDKLLHTMTSRHWCRDENAMFTTSFEKLLCTQRMQLTNIRVDWRTIIIAYNAA